MTLGKDPGLAVSPVLQQLSTRAKRDDEAKKARRGASLQMEKTRTRLHVPGPVHDSGLLKEPGWPLKADVTPVRDTMQSLE